MPRYGAKTYSRTLRAGTSANKQFDDLFTDSNARRRPVTRSSPTKASPTKTSPMKSHNAVVKQTAPGNAVRSTRNSEMDTLGSPKRRRMDSGSDDPFSFSSDDDASRSPIKRSDARTVTTSPNKFSGLESQPAMRQTRASSAQALADSKIQTRSSGNTKPIALGDRTKKQASIMRYAKKLSHNESDRSAPYKATSALSNSNDAVRTIVAAPSNSRSNADKPHPKSASTNSVESLSQVSNSSESSSALYSLNSTPNSGRLSPSQVLNSVITRASSSEDDAVMLLSDGDGTQSVISISDPQLSSTTNQTSSKPSNPLQAPSQKTIPPKPQQASLPSVTVSAKDEFDFTDSGESDAEDNPDTSNAITDFKDNMAKKIFNSPKKSPAKARYNARSWNTPSSPEEPEEKSVMKKPKSQPSLRKYQSDPSSRASTSGYSSRGARPEVKGGVKGLTRQVTYPTKVNHSIVTSLKCDKQEKGLYTVVQHVKQATQCQESGESQQYADDIEYLRDGLDPMVSTSTRCLSTLSLVEKCAVPAFRLHLRAHGTISKLFAALRDADHFPSLALCTAGLMYMLSRDRLNMDLDRDSLGLLVRLLSVESEMSQDDWSEIKKQDYDRTKEKLRSILQEVPSTCTMAKDLDLDGLSSEYLAMESLLSLTSRRAGEWFKEELRQFGGLEHIADTVISLGEKLAALTPGSDPANLELINRLSWCLRVLENVTFLNTENQQYLLELNDCSLVKAFASMLPLCAQRVECCRDQERTLRVGKEKTPGGRMRQCLLALLRVLLNITHDNEWGSMKVGEQSGLISNTLVCVLKVAQHIAHDQRFDLLVLSLGVLINLVEHCPGNAKILTNTMTSYSYDAQMDDSGKFTTSGEVCSLEALTQLFMQRYRAASRAEREPEPGEEQHEDENEDYSEAQAGLEWLEIETSGTGGPNDLTEEEIKRSVSKVLHTAGKHMEDSIVASYTALLIGCLVKDNHMNVTRVRSFLPEGDFNCMVQMLQKFLSFIELTNAAGNTGNKSISKIIEVLDHL
ncbi:wings apart-like protein homolog [Acanthaster planci]|uniref:Wings apart-like protein homolog n=1 Tax=Acanthaster planci TaxID=133434 RepID=A0A8B8A4Q8_ACAPL|nr:wings apart-like protein homolog [Acanthaster planci]